MKSFLFFLFIFQTQALKYDLFYSINNNFVYEVIFQHFGVSKFGTFEIDYSISNNIQLLSTSTKPSQPFLLILLLKQTQFNSWYKLKLSSDISTYTLALLCSQPSEYRLGKQIQTPQCLLFIFYMFFQQKLMAPTMLSSSPPAPMNMSSCY